MCFICGLRALVNGGTYLRVENPEDVDSAKPGYKLNKAAGVDSDLVQQYVSKVLMDPIDQEYRISGVFSEHEYALADLYANVKMCITMLVLMNSVGPRLATEDKDSLAIRVMEQIMSEFSRHSEHNKEFEKIAFTWFLSLSKKQEHAILRNLPYAIINEMSEIIYHPDSNVTLENFFSRPFIMYYIRKDSNNFLLTDIIQRWNKTKPDQGVPEDLLVKLCFEDIPQNMTQETDTLTVH